MYEVFQQNVLGLDVKQVVFSYYLMGKNHLALSHSFSTSRKKSIIFLLK